MAPLKGEHAEAIEAEALETSDIVNMPLSDVKIPKGAIVGAIVRKGEIIIPRGDSIIRPKDHLIIFALQQIIPSLKNCSPLNWNTSDAFSNYNAFYGRPDFFPGRFHGTAFAGLSFI